MKPQISIIAPTKNEAENIELFVLRTHKALTEANIIYEIIFIDDHSTDQTQTKIKKLQKKYQIQLYIKQGKIGKSYSLLEGFTHIQSPIICMIDSDLQYSPEYIPQMVKKIIDGADIVVAERTSYEFSKFRRLSSKIFSTIFIKFLNGIRYDSQSGLKVFKKEIIERLTFNPTAWSFDLEFLKKSIEAGYSIDTVNITFEKRNGGTSKIRFFQASMELAMHAVKMKFAPSEIIPFHKDQGKGFHFKGNAFKPFNELPFNQSALTRLRRDHSFMLLSFLYLYIVFIFINWHAVLEITVGLLSLMYFIDLLFNLFLIYRSFSKTKDLAISKKQLRSLTDNDCPQYTVFCPLYKEWSVVSQFISAIDKLDYPKNKLQVMLLLEEDDVETITKVSEIAMPNHFEIVIVPHAKPKTKPKALNYGMQFAKGEYVVIYDAEDIPESDQLKKVVIAFGQAKRNVVCIQAKLNFYNPRQNLLTRLFTAEYSLWFDLVLTGLQSINAPIPLGGTSNHFRIDKLKEISGWDAFNVTEDADLGMRLVKAGYKTSIIDSTTYEEANSSYTNWFNQRSRWIKGYIQTYFVHMRNPRALIRGINDMPLITFNLIIGGKVLSMFINPFMWTITIVYFVARAKYGAFIESLFPGPILYIGVISLLFGNFLFFYYYLLGVAKRGYDDLMKYLIFVPFYWLAMSVAAWKASAEFIYKPFYWSKTTHGLHLTKDPNKSYSLPFTSIIDQSAPI